MGKYDKQGEKEHGRKGLTLTEALELSEYYKVPLQYLVDKIGVYDDTL